MFFCRIDDFVYNTFFTEYLQANVLDTFYTVSVSIAAVLCKLICKSPYSVQIRKRTDQEIFEFEQFSHIEYF